MKLKLKVEKEYDVTILQVNAKVRYWEDTEVDGVEDDQGDLIPCRVGESWLPKIDVETGEILNWVTGKKAKVHYKVCDAGVYRLYDSEDNIVCEHDGYVPRCMCPAENGYGDYIIMSIDENGMIENWKFDADDFIPDND